MLKQIEGSQGVAQAVALCRPDVVCAYPISPQTHIVENLGLLCRKGVLQDCEYINVESEFAAMSVAIGASVAGGRAYTATASQGLLYMAEAVYNASGLGLPVVMTVANRAIGAPINIWNDHSDSMSQRDCGWIQLFAETNQEACDLHIQAFRIAEELSIPVMVCMDGFVLTHAFERQWTSPIRLMWMYSCHLIHLGRYWILIILIRLAQWWGQRLSLKCVGLRMNTCWQPFQ